MNLTGNGTFEQGNTLAKHKAGKKHKSTIVKELLSKNISNVDNRLYEITFELLNSKNLKIKAFAWKELLKYRLPIKPEINSSDQQITEVKVNICESREDVEFFQWKDECEKIKELHTEDNL